MQSTGSRRCNYPVSTKELANTLEALVQGAIFQFAFLNERDIEVHLKAHIRALLRPYAV